MGGSIRSNGRRRRCDARLMPSMGCQGLFAIGSHQLLRVIHSWQCIGYTLSSLPSVSNTQSGAVMTGLSGCTPHSSPSVFGYYWHCRQLLWILLWLSRAEDAVSGLSRVKRVYKGMALVYGGVSRHPLSLISRAGPSETSNHAPLQKLTCKFLKRCMSVCTL